MTTTKKAGKRTVKKLKLKRETLKDLDAKRGGVRGGMARRDCGDSCQRTAAGSGCSEGTLIVIVV